MFVCVFSHMEDAVIVVERPLARRGGVEGLRVGGCVVRRRQRVGVIGFL